MAFKTNFMLQAILSVLDDYYRDNDTITVASLKSILGAAIEREEAEEIKWEQQNQEALNNLDNF